MRTLLIYSIFLCFTFACSNASSEQVPPNAEHTEAPESHGDHKHTIPSRTPMERAAMYVRAVDLAKNVTDHQSTFSHNGKNYQLSHKVLEGTVVKVAAKTSLPEGDMEEVFYLKEAGPVAVRHFHKQYSGDENPTAELIESFYYFDNTKVAEAKQRTKVEPADGNHQFTNEAFEIMETNLDSITSLLYKNMKLYKDHIKK